VVVVATFYSGMHPQQTEADITNSYERYFTLGSGINHIESRSLPGVSLIKIYFQPKPEDKADEAKPEVKADAAKPEDKADEAKPEDKDDVAKPEAKDKEQSNVTPQLVKRVRELYEELGREDVQTVPGWEKSDPATEKTKSPK
jgi:multidrug efflux pump subunit AcrB